MASLDHSTGLYSRYVYVCHPQLAKLWCTQKQARAAVIATISLAVLHMVPRILDRQYTIIDIGNYEKPSLFSFWVGFY